MVARILASTMTPQPRNETSGLATCMHCHCDFVAPLDWEPVRESGWWMLLRCGGCGLSREVTVSNTIAERFDEELARQARQIRRAADRLELERMESEVDAFAAALEHGFIEPADFSAAP